MAYMEDFKHKLGAILLAIMVLFSTMSFAADMHFCGKTLVDFKLFQEAETCGMMGANGDLEEDSFSQSMPCCSDIEILLEGHDDLQCGINDITLELSTFLAVHHDYFLEYSPDFPQSKEQFREYRPPLLIWDIHILHQIFLI